MSQQQSGYTIRQTAKLLDVSTQRIWALAKSGYLKTIQDNGLTYVSMSSLVVYLQGRINELGMAQKKYEKVLRELAIPIDNKA